MAPLFRDITKILGYFPKDSVVVLGTKKNDVNPIKYENRCEYIEEVMAEFGVPKNKYMDFNTPCHAINYHEKDFSPAQYSDLSKLLTSCAPV